MIQPRRIISDGRPDYTVDAGITEAEAEFLCGLAISLRPRTIVEIGTGPYSRSLQALMRARAWLRHHLGWPCDVWSFDVKADCVAAAARRFPEAHVCVITGFESLADQMPRHIDLAFIDGEHTVFALERDLALVTCGTDDNSIIVCHDASEWHKPVRSVARKLKMLILPTAKRMAIMNKQP